MARGKRKPNVNLTRKNSGSRIEVKSDTPFQHMAPKNRKQKQQQAFSILTHKGRKKQTGAAVKQSELVINKHRAALSTVLYIGLNTCATKIEQELETQVASLRNALAYAELRLTNPHEIMLPRFMKESCC